MLNLSFLGIGGVELKQGAEQGEGLPCYNEAMDGKMSFYTNT